MRASHVSNLAEVKIENNVVKYIAFKRKEIIVT